MKKKIHTISSIFIVVNIILCLGVTGNLECNSISIKQAFMRVIIFIGVLAVSAAINKKTVDVSANNIDQLEK